MKSFVTIFSLMLISCAGFAQVAVKVAPVYPVQCKDHEKHHEFVNRVDNVQQAENDKMLVVDFDTYLFTCTSTEVIPQDISKYTVFRFLDNRNLLNYYSPEIEIIPASYSENHIVLQFDKSKLFKQNGEIQKILYSYTMETQAALQHVSGRWDENVLGGPFSWYVRLTYDPSTDSTEVHIGQ